MVRPTLDVLGRFVVAAAPIVTILSLSAAAAAEPPRAVAPAPEDLGGLYIASRAGVTKPNDTLFSTVTVGRVRTDYDIGSFSGAALGYRFAPFPGLGVTPRVELEGGFGRFSVARHSVNGVERAKVDSFGELQSITGFGSGYLDLDLAGIFGITGPLAALRPFVGGGIGIANVQFKKQGVSTIGTLIDSDDTRFAYHLSGGIGIELARFGIGTQPGSFLKNAAFEVGYRRVEAPDVSARSRDGASTRTNFTANLVTIGLRRGF